MARFIVNVVAMVLVFLVGGAVFGVDPTMPELILVCAAWMAGDFFEGLIFGERR